MLKYLFNVLYLGNFLSGLKTSSSFKIVIWPRIFGALSPQPQYVLNKRLTTKLFLWLTSAKMM